MLFARCCGSCGVPGPSPCAACVDTFEPVGEVDIDGLERCLALVAYDAGTGPLISQVKRGGDRRAIRWLARGLAELTEARRLQPDVITWIPAMPANRARRGFDQSQVLAARLGCELGVPCRPLLGRRGRRAQTGRSRRDRLRGPELVATGTCAGTVALVDDVVTTGASLLRGAHALRAAGAAEVVGLVATRRFDRQVRPVPGEGSVTGTVENLTKDPYLAVWLPSKVMATIDQPRRY